MSEAAVPNEVTAAPPANDAPLLSEEFQGLNLIDLIEKLEPPPSLDPVSLWPQTEIWSWIFLLLLVLLSRTSYKVLLRWQANAYRRAACQEARAAGNDTTALAAILRRTALAAYPRSEVASLYGEDWLQFLEQRCHGLNFSHGPGRQLIEAPYRIDDQPQAGSELSQLALDWIKGHTAMPATPKEISND